jgi:hypothetical protein
MIVYSSPTGKDKTGYGNNWVIAGIIVALPAVSRPVCLPVLARLVVKGTNSKVAAVAGPPHDRRPGRRPARPGDPCRR